MNRNCPTIINRNLRYWFCDWWISTRVAGRIWFSLAYVVPVYAGIMLFFWFCFNVYVLSWQPLIISFDRNYLVVAMLLYPILGYILGGWVFWYCEKIYRNTIAGEGGGRNKSRQARSWAEARKKGVFYHVILRGMLRDGMLITLFFAGQPLPYVLNLYSYTLMVSSRVPGQLADTGDSLAAFLFGPFLWYLVIPVVALIGASVYYWRFEKQYKAWNEEHGQ